MNKSSFKIIFTGFAAAYLLLGVLALQFGWVSGDSVWNVAVTTRLPSFDVYSHYLNPINTPMTEFTGSASVHYPPLILFLIYPFVVLGGFLGWDITQIGKVYPVVLLVIDVVTIHTLLFVIAWLNPRLKRDYLIAISAILFFSGYFFFSSAHEGRPENLVIFFYLSGLYQLIQKRRVGVAGLLFGGALLAKQSALFLIVPILLYLVFAKKRLREMLAVSFLSLVVFGLLLSPFLVHDFTNTWNGVIGFSVRHAVVGPNLWWLFISIADKVFHLPQTIYFAIQWSQRVLFLVLCIISALLIARKKVRNEHHLLSLTLLFVLSFYLFASATIFHYFLLIFITLLLWETSRRTNKFPHIWLVYTLLLFAFNFMQIPVWQLLTVLLNLGMFVFIWNDLENS